MTTLQDLLTRVEAATGPDRPLDADIHRMVHGIGERGVVLWTDVAPYVESVDAALALVDRLLPGCVYQMGTMQSGIEGGWAQIWLADSTEGGDCFSTDSKRFALPLAILAALLKALIAQEATRKETA